MIGMIPPAFWDGMICGIFLGAIFGILIANAIYIYVESRTGKLVGKE
jgi:hypothetical protein